MRPCASDRWEASRPLRSVVFAILLIVGGVAGGSAILILKKGDKTPDSVIRPRGSEGSAITVGAGTTPGGVPWTLVAYEGDGGLCLELQGVSAANGGGGGCTFDVPGQHSVSVNTEAFSEPAVTVIYGPLAHKVTRVGVSLSDGRTLTLHTIGGPIQTKFGVRAYVTLVPGAPHVTAVTGKSATGALVEERAG
jgi:hypothetical protein